MSRRTIDIYYDVVSNVLRNSSGARLNQRLYEFVIYKEKPLVRLRLVTDEDLTAYTAFDASMTYSAAIDKDFDHDSALMCKTLNADINRPSDWGDADAATGKFSIRIDANTARYAAVLATAEKKSASMLELQAFDVNGDLVGVVRFPFITYNLMDDNGSVPPAATEDYYTKTESDARFVRKTANQQRFKVESNYFRLWNPDAGDFYAIELRGPVGAQTIVVVEGV